MGKDADIVVGLWNSGGGDGVRTQYAGNATNNIKNHSADFF